MDDHTFREALRAAGLSNTEVEEFAESAEQVSNILDANSPGALSIQAVRVDLVELVNSVRQYEVEFPAHARAMYRQAYEAEQTGEAVS